MTPYKKAIVEAMSDLAKLSNTVFVGYNLKYGSKGYGTLTGVPESKIIEMPVAEALMTGLCTGLSLTGYLPILIFERHDFLLLAADQIVNHLIKIEELSCGDFKPKVIIRAIVGGTRPFDPGIQHKQRFSTEFTLSGVRSFVGQTDDEIKECYKIVKLIDESLMVTEFRDLY